MSVDTRYITIAATTTKLHTESDTRRLSLSPSVCLSVCATS